MAPVYLIGLHSLPTRVGWADAYGPISASIPISANAKYAMRAREDSLAFFCCLQPDCQLCAVAQNDQTCTAATNHGMARFIFCQARPQHPRPEGAALILYAPRS
jgi:hypothetical protein